MNTTHDCAYCHQANATSKCSRCNTSYYCNKYCQRLDWNDGHKKACQPRAPAQSPRSNSNNPSEDPETKKFMKSIEKFRLMAEQAKVLTERNRGVIVEVHNCAVFLSQVNDMIGKNGPTFFDMEIREDAPSAKPGNMIDSIVSANISKKMLGVPIGRTGASVTMDDIISMLRGIPSDDGCIRYSIELLFGVKKMLGKKGPCYFEHGIVTNSNRDATLDGQREAPIVVPGTIGSVQANATGELKRVQIVKDGDRVTMNDIVAAFYFVSTHGELEKFRKSGRAYFHEGFNVSGNGKTLSMRWGS